MSVSETLTQHLQSLSTVVPYTAATEHAFLVAAGTGKLSKEHLGLYLYQDRLYAAHAYPRFIGHLISAIPFSSLHAIRSKAEQDNQHIIRSLTYSLQNVVREINFFVETADKYGLRLEGWKERKATRDYMDSMAAVSSWGSLADGLVFLWAMEQVYLDSWRHVKSLLATSKEESPASAAVRELAANWTNDEFVDFVNDLADLVNQQNLQPGSSEWARAEEIWARVVELEEAFWPLEKDLALLKV
ncbi:hypothetical protein EIP86_006061 [Pleurotus ostreatoroseus]|nr:hypothetical protein EIP86_006061 [Pleurotus ostreatoroseus]